MLISGFLKTGVPPFGFMLYFAVFSVKHSFNQFLANFPISRHGMGELISQFLGMIFQLENICKMYIR